MKSKTIMTPVFFCQIKVRIQKVLLIILFIFLFIPLFCFAESFNRDLYFGLKNDPDVSRLQDFLIIEDLYSGPVTGNFWYLTLEGVKKFQIREGITPVSGYF